MAAHTIESIDFDTAFGPDVPETGAGEIRLQGLSLEAGHLVISRSEVVKPTDGPEHYLG